MTLADLLLLVTAHEQPQRKAVSTLVPALAQPVRSVRQAIKHMANRLQYNLARTKSDVPLPCVLARHQSVLARAVGTSDPALQAGKIQNLQRACQDLNGLLIQPGEVFSLWETLGNPTHERGYADGMLLSDGRIISGPGGGLCQLSNFLCWLFLHAEVEVVERFHHSMDVFPDSGRVLPFGSGATCLYNTVDLKMKNVGSTPLQLALWLTSRHLKGQLLSDQPAKHKFSIVEKEHCFMKRGTAYYRYNEIWRVTKANGKELSQTKIFTNFAPVLYQVPASYFTELRYPLIDLTDIQLDRR